MSELSFSPFLYVIGWRRLIDVSEASTISTISLASCWLGEPVATLLSMVNKRGNKQSLFHVFVAAYYLYGISSNHGRLYPGKWKNFI